MDVLILGAGPAGLSLAVDLTRRGIRCRVVDRRPTPRPGTRGCTVWQRTLELLDLLGADVDGYTAQAVPFRQRIYHLPDHEPLSVEVTEPASRRPLALVVGQDVTEALLTRRLIELGGAVERGITAVGVTEHGDGVTVNLAHADERRERARAGWVVVAEGSRSPSRHAVDIGWPVRPVPGTQLLQVDARVRGKLPGDPRECHLYLTEQGTLGVLPLPDGRFRVFAGVSAQGRPATGDPGVAELERVLREMTGRPDVSLVDGRFSRRLALYDAVAETFRRGRVLLLGDTARTVMPVTAQGMNTCVADAVNLGWKLAAVIAGGAPDRLLDSYEAERRPIAHKLVATTRRTYWGGVGELPSVEMAVANIRAQRSARTGMPVGYAGGPLTVDALGGDGCPAGNRAPDASVTDAGGVRRRVYDTLGHGGWTLLAFPDEPATARTTADAMTIADAVAGRPVAVRVLTGAAGPPVGPDRLIDSAGAARRAYTGGRPGLCLIRPDGYVGLRAPLGDAAAVRGYLTGVLG